MLTLFPPVMFYLLQIKLDNLITDLDSSIIKNEKLLEQFQVKYCLIVLPC